MVETEAQAREIAAYREKTAKDKRAAVGAATTLEQLMAKAKADQSVAELPVLVKADVQGSAEAIVQALEKIGNDEVRVRVLHYGVGAITDTDVVWPKPRARRSSASTCGPMRRRERRPPKGRRDPLLLDHL